MAARRRQGFIVAALLLGIVLGTQGLGRWNPSREALAAER